MSFEIPIEMNAVQLIAMICRIGAFIFAFPFFSTDHIPMRYKMFITVALAFCMIPCLGDAWSVGSGSEFAKISMLKMCMIIGSEIMMGAAIVFFVQATVDIFAYAGTVMDMDVGFNATQEFDPDGETRTVFAYLLTQLFMVAFLVGDMHLEVLKIAASSFQTLPPGGFALDGTVIETMIRAVSAIFLMGLQIALPVMAAMFMINLGMAVLARIGEDFPVMVLSFALHLGVGIIIFGAVLPTTLELCRRMGLKMMEGLLQVVGG